MDRKLLAEFVSTLNATEQWAERYTSSPKLTESERDAARLLLQYIYKARLYSLEFDAKPRELRRRLKKIGIAYWKLHRKWLESGRH